MTLLLLLFGTISDVFVVRATWPIVRYKNGTVGVKNDGGTVKVQSTDLIVDGNLSVSGSLFIQDRDLAEYAENISRAKSERQSVVSRDSFRNLRAGRWNECIF